MKTMLVRALAPTIAAVGLALAPAARAAEGVSCGHGNPAQILPLSVSTPLYGTATGYYTVPAGRPRALVVFSHGFEASPTRWFGAMQLISAKTRAITIALYNPGDVIVPGNPPTPANQGTRGWWVTEGAAAGIAAAQLFDRSRRSLARAEFVDYGVSMGGNTSGLMAAAGAKRSHGRPLFDYWFDIEGATNVIETYLEAKAVGATGNAYANDAWQAIQADAGGQSPDQNPQGYEGLDVVAHAPAIKASGIKGVVMVQGALDGLVPYDQTREMEAALAAVGVPTDLYTALTKQPGTNSGTTLDQYIPVPHDSPFAGHGSEGDLNHTVTGTGIALLARTLLGQIPPPACHREFLIDGTAGSLLNPGASPLIVPDPATTPDPPCPA